MRVGVTGASGFTGRYVMPALAQRGHVPVALEADLTDRGAVQEEVAAVRPEAVIHLAGRAFVDQADYGAFYAVNQIGTFNLLESLSTEVPAAAVLLASSAQVYGGRASGLIAETAPIRPANHYALSKAAMEMGSSLYADRLRITIARPFNYTGVGQEERFLIPKLVAHFVRREPSIELGNINVERDFGDVRGVVDAYCGLIERSPGGVVNVSTGVVTSVETILDILHRKTGHVIQVTVNDAFLRPDDIRTLGGNNRLLQTVLPHWQPPSFDETLDWMLQEKS